MASTTPSTGETVMTTATRYQATQYKLTCNDGGLSDGYAATIVVKPNAAPGGIVVCKMFAPDGMEALSMRETTDINGGRIVWKRWYGFGFRKA